MNMDRVEVLAVLRACEQLARNRHESQKRDFDRMLASGRVPHLELAVKAEWAQYIRDQVREARSAFAELSEATKAVEQAALPFGLLRAPLLRLQAAMARAGVV